MTTAEVLLEAQTQRWRRLDPLLPPAAPPPNGDVISARTGDGPVAGMLTRIDHPAGALPRLWSASHVCELVPVLGDAGPDAIDALLRAWVDHLPALDLPDDDSSCVVAWPSRDITMTRALLDHGFAPLSVIAVHTPVLPGKPATGPVRVRQAGPADVDACVRLAMYEQEYSAMVGSTVLRPETRDLKRAVLAGRLQTGAPVWLAEVDGVAVGLAECGYTEAVPGNWMATRLQPGQWGYINCASVDPQAREQGVGDAMVSTVHTAFADASVVGSFLYYNPPNPLSSVFWPRRGYRPLWTIWEVRPATALR